MSPGLYGLFPGLCGCLRVCLRVYVSGRLYGLCGVPPGLYCLRACVGWYAARVYHASGLASVSAYGIASGRVWCPAPGLVWSPGGRLISGRTYPGILLMGVGDFVTIEAAGGTPSPLSPKKTPFPFPLAFTLRSSQKWKIYSPSNQYFS